MEVVGSCPQCGAPIYAPTGSNNTKPPPITYTCECRLAALAHPPARPFVCPSLFYVDPPLEPAKITVRYGTGDDLRWYNTAHGTGAGSWSYANG